MRRTNLRRDNFLTPLFQLSRKENAWELSTVSIHEGATDF